MGFEEFKGNPRVREYLISAFARKTVPHAFLISGNNEEEQTSLAKILSSALVCTGESAPCGSCAACKKAAAGLHPDIIWKECEKASIGVNEIRAIRNDAYVLPNDGEKKVYIIKQSDKMTHEAQDALLKILEEPPRFTNFILLCYNHSSLLTTIMSRVTHLKLQSTEDETNIPEEEFLSPARELIHAISKRSEIEVLKALVACEKKKRDEMKEILQCAILMLRDGMVLSCGCDDCILGNEASKEVGKNLSTKEIIAITDVLKDALALIPRNVGVAHLTAKIAVEIHSALI